MVSNSNQDSSSMTNLFSAIFLCVVGALGIFANVLIVLVFWKYHRLRTATNLFLLNLGLCDLAIALLDVIFSIVSTWQQEWMFSHDTCITYGFLHYFFACATISTLAGISIDRFYVITKPADGLWITKPRAGIMILIIHLYTLLFTFPPLLGWSEFTLEINFQSGCYINFDDQKLPTLLYSIVVTLFFFMIPFIIMFYCYYHIFMTVRRSTKRKLAAVIIPRHKSLRRPLSTQAHVKTARMISIVLIFFVVVWAPYFVIALLRTMWKSGKVPQLFAHISILLTKTCIIYNAVIYVVVNHKFRNAFMNTLCCWRKQRPTSHLPGRESVFSKGHSRIDSFHNSPKTISNKRKEKGLFARSLVNGDVVTKIEDHGDDNKRINERNKQEIEEDLEYKMDKDEKTYSLGDTLGGKDNDLDLMNQTQITELQFESSLDENSFWSKRRGTPNRRVVSPVQNGEVVLDFDTLDYEAIEPKTSTPYHTEARVPHNNQSNGYLVHNAGDTVQEDYEKPPRNKTAHTKGPSQELKNVDKVIDNVPTKKQIRVSRSPVISVNSNCGNLDGVKLQMNNGGSVISPRLGNERIMSPKHELMDVQNYWKRMSLLLDDISIDDITI